MATRSVYQVVGIRVSKSRIYDYIRSNKKAHAKFLKNINYPEYVNITEYDSCIFKQVVDDCGLFYSADTDIDVFTVTIDRDNSGDFIIGHVVSATYCLNTRNDPNIELTIAKIINISNTVSKYFVSIGFVEPVNMYTAQN